MRAADIPQAGRERGLGADAATAAAVLLLGVFLAGTGGSLLQRWRLSSVRHQSLGFDDQLGIAANTAGLIVIAWWALSLLIAVAAACLEFQGSLRAASATGKFAPAFMRRLALAALGLHLLSAPLAAASTPLPAPAAAAPTASAAWIPTAIQNESEPFAPVPGPTTPQPGTRMEDPAATSPQWRPLRPVVEPGPLAGRLLRDQQPAGQPGEVTVQPGDSLWSLSAARLGPFSSDVDVAGDWPKIYSANRDIIGGNPDVLQPGQVLRLPSGE